MRSVPIHGSESLPVAEKNSRAVPSQTNTWAEPGTTSSFWRKEANYAKDTKLDVTGQKKTIAIRLC